MAIGWTLKERIVFRVPRSSRRSSWQNDRLTSGARVRYLAHVANHEAHPLVGFQDLNSFIVRGFFKTLSVDFDDLVADHKTSSVGDAVLVDTGDVDAEPVLEAPSDHKAQGLARFNAKFNLSSSRAKSRVPRGRHRSTLAIHPAARLLSTRATRHPRGMTASTPRV